MNILFLTLSFSTSSHKSFYEDLLREFLKRGEKIFVVCAKENKSEEQGGLSVSEDGLTIIRVPTGNITGNVPILEKGCATISIDRQFMNAINKYLGDVAFDLILYPTPPITLVNTITAIKRKTHAKTYLLLKDIFPQNAVDLGIMSKTGIGVKSIIYKYFRRKERQLYCISDYIGCMSPANVEYVLTKNPFIRKEQVEVCPNCLSIPDAAPTFKRDNLALKKEYGIPGDAVVFIYGGNLGKPQGIGFLIECLRYVKDNRKAFFMIIGEGSEFNRIQKYIDEEKPSNVKLLHYMPKDDYQRISNQCDVGMLFLDHRFTIPNFPSRILNYLVSGNPVLAATDPCSDIGTIARDNGFGFCCESNDVKGFEKAVNDFIEADREEMGKKGWEFFERNWTVEKGYETIIKHFLN